MSNTISSVVRDFFGNLIIHRTKDAWGPILVIDYRQYRNLTFDSLYDQSSMNIKKPHILVHDYTRAMMLVLAFIKPSHATFLGLGGGCLLRSLNHILPDCELHAIELRQRVYEIANEFFGIPVSDKITISIADAKQRLTEIDNNSTDIIFADLYYASSMNPFQIQKRFIHQCYRVLDSMGWLVINYHELPDLTSSFFKYLSDLFSDIFVCQTINKKNTILFASKQHITVSLPSELTIIALEKQLEVKLSPLFKRLTKLKPDDTNNESSFLALISESKTLRNQTDGN